MILPQKCFMLIVNGTIRSSTCASYPVPVLELSIEYHGFIYCMLSMSMTDLKKYSRHEIATNSQPLFPIFLPFYSPVVFCGTAL